MDVINPSLPAQDLAATILRRAQEMLAAAGLTAEIKETGLAELIELYLQAARAEGIAEGLGIVVGPVAPNGELVADDLGTAAILYVIAMRGCEQATEAGEWHTERLFEQADNTAIEALIGDVTAFLDLDASRDVPLPDLSPWGVRQCRDCGCTEEVACPEGCSWVDDDRCSRCAAAT